ncbi:hypothetical protein CRYUN_Cryun01aG0149300 [Craigia yunnanensis]
MNGLASASTPTSTFSSIQQSKIQSCRYINPCNPVVIPVTHLCSSDLSLKSCSFGGARVPQRSSIICRSSTGPGAPGSGDDESRNVLDAFFLGKALAEALNERIESTIGEFLSVVGLLPFLLAVLLSLFQALCNSLFANASMGHGKVMHSAGPLYVFVVLPPVGLRYKLSNFLKRVNESNPQYTIAVFFLFLYVQMSEKLSVAGDDESRNVLDAFFLGKALAEALNERIESTIGEFLSVVGRLQAEQQKQVLDFQPCAIAYLLMPQWDMGRLCILLDHYTCLFFLGKALAEALNERIESTIGEFLSVVGRLQAEQQKQVLDFQEEVLERAKRAKEKAAREAVEAQGLIPKSTAVSATSVTNGAPSKVSSSTANDRISGNSSSYNPGTPVANTDPGPAKKE